MLSAHRGAASIAGVLALSFLLMLGGCYTMSVSSDHDPAFDRSKYVTYDWSLPGEGLQTPSDPAVDPFVDSRVRTAVDRELAARGCQLKTTGPVDFIVGVHVETKLRAAIYQDPFLYPRGYYRGHYYHYDPWWGYPSRSYVGYYEEGLLAIDVIDALSKKLVWRGQAWGAVRAYPDPVSMQGDIDRAVRKILDQFSPISR
ncbi:MAG: DUF4136 domain-containing protein [Chlorobiaceae bacterium]